MKMVSQTTGGGSSYSLSLGMIPYNLDNKVTSSRFRNRGAGTSDVLHFKYIVILQISSLRAVFAFLLGHFSALQMTVAGVFTCRTLVIQFLVIFVVTQIVLMN